MLRIKRKCPTSVPVTEYALCAFNIFWRNPKVDRPRPGECHVDPENRRINIVPSIFHDLGSGDTSSHSYNIIGINMKSIQNVLTDDGFEFTSKDRIFYYHGEKDVEIEIENDYDLFEALIYCKKSKPQSVKMIIEGDFLMTKNGLQKMKPSTQPLEPSVSPSSSEDIDMMNWFQNYMHIYKKEIIGEFMTKVKESLPV